MHRLSVRYIKATISDFRRISKSWVKPYKKWLRKHHLKVILWTVLTSLGIIFYLLSRPPNVVILDEFPYKPVSVDIKPIKARHSELPVAQVKAVTKPVAQPVGNDSLSQWLYKLRMCESGGNYSINTGNGYYGAYQFSEPTWNSWNTGYAFAHLAPPAVQDATIVKNTNAASGGLATQNPGCYASEGLSQFPPS